ncbi:MAG: site-specific DNA-methyltransferase [Planctomycetota bacterium]|nr:MAG: site-specific DNA-methyltransferase [Planctomycetota bacterium]
MDTPAKVDLKSMSITDEQKAKLKQLFPEVFNEDKIDFDKLKRTLGEEIDTGEERFGMTWPGKNDCFKVIQTPSIATLKPAKDESVNWDNTENLFIEGDNLEVLKLLQRSYYGKVKMIYIDPPYNTGKEFVYPDKYSESLETYLAYTGQLDAEGVKFSTNTETEGRFHSKWMSMMYPRLFLANNLLREDGVICVSIDDNEMSHLRCMMDAIFGKENCLGELIWDLGTGTAAGHFTRSHEYVLVFAKDKPSLSNFKYKGNSDRISERAVKKISRGNPASRITFPAGVEFEGNNAIFKGTLGRSEKITIVDGVLRFQNGKLAEPVTIEAGWAMRNQILSWLAGEDTYDTKGQRVTRFYFNNKGVLQYEKERGFINPPSVLRQIASTKKGSEELVSLFGAKVLDFPKPVRLIQYLVELICNNGDILMDFFAGSCPSAEATYRANITKCKNLTYICIQLPEKCNPNEETGKNAISLGFGTVADIGKERIRRVIKKIKEEQAADTQKAKESLPGMAEEQAELDLGFRVFKLDKSNFNIWDGTVDESGDISGQIEMFIDHIDPDASDEDILYELLLKSGFELTTKIEELDLAGKKVYSIADNALLICLDRKLTKEVITEMAKLQPARVVCLDAGFTDNDQLKTNAVQIMRSHDVEDFRTV